MSEISVKVFYKIIPVFPKPYVIMHFLSFSDPSKLVRHVFELFLISESCWVDVI